MENAKLKVVLMAGMLLACLALSQGCKKASETVRELAEGSGLTSCGQDCMLKGTRASDACEQEFGAGTEWAKGCQQAVWTGVRKCQDDCK
jgi:hypothetical protein